MPISIRQVAERAGVSRATVSRVLNGDTEALVALPTRQRIRAVAHEMGYHPSAVARGLAGKPMNSLGVVLAYDLPSVTSDPFLGPALDGILKFNKSQHQKTVLFAEDDWGAVQKNLPIYLDGHCDGLILVIPRTDTPMIAALKNSGRPFIVLGDSREEPEVSFVDSDNFACAKIATTLLLEAGHRRVAILNGNTELQSSRQRLEGFLAAHREAGIAIDERRIVSGEYWEDSAYFGAGVAMALPKAIRPTALFCSNGRIAVGAMRWLNERNIRVPDEFSLSALSESATVLATLPVRGSGVVLPILDIGYEAARQVWSQIHQDVPAGTTVLLPGQRADGDSIAPPPL